MESASSGDLGFSALPEFPLDAGDGGHPHRATYSTALHWTSLVAQTVKRLPTMRETWVPSLGQEDPLEKEIATHSSILARKIPWMEEPG